MRCAKINEIKIDFNNVDKLKYRLISIQFVFGTHS